MGERSLSVNRSIRIAISLCMAALLVMSVGCVKQEPTQATVTVSAAASLQDALMEIQHNYEQKQSDIKVVFNFGSSGALQQQIEQGAPVDVFFSAAEDKFHLLVDKGLIQEDEMHHLLGNELVLISLKEKAAEIEGFQSLKNNSIKQIAMGTPESVPAGKYGQQVLTALNVWDDIKEKLVYGKDVRQVLTYVETNNVDAGIVYKTDALLSDKVEIIETAAKDAHDPIIYPLGIVKETKQKAEAMDFYKYLQTNESLQVFEKYGFTIEN